MKKKVSKKYKWKAAAAAILLATLAFASKSPSDSYIRSRVVKLMGNNIMCSGEQVRAPSGQDYILTAAHCAPTAIDGSVLIITEDGKHIQRKIIAEDPNSDLLLLEGLPNLRGLNVASNDYRFQHVRTFTHGLNMDTFETTGNIIQDKFVMVPISRISTPEEAIKCSQMPKNRVEEGFGEQLCVLEVSETATTAPIEPGSSGGIMLNDSGDIIGVASATDGTFGYMVRLKDIKTFLSAY